jgi:ADP-ribosylglycohydrolase
VGLASSGVYLHACDSVSYIGQCAASDAQLTHPNPSCQHAQACYAVAIASLLKQPGERKHAMSRANEYTKKHCDAKSEERGSEVLQWLDDAEQRTYIRWPVSFVFRFRMRSGI